jgi:hypothetical protein
VNDRFVGLSADDPPKSSASRPAARTSTMVAIGGSRSIMIYPHAHDHLPRLEAWRHWFLAIHPAFLAFHNLHCARRWKPDGPCAGHFLYQLAKEALGFAKTAHTRLLRAHHPSYLHSMVTNSHTRSRCAFICDVFSFSISKEPVEKRCGSMQDNINCKLDCLGQYFPGLVLGPRPAKARAISSVPSISRSNH